MKEPPTRRVYDRENGWMWETDVTDLNDEELKAWLEKTFPDPETCPATYRQP